jgi:hypothetical protein
MPSKYDPIEDKVLWESEAIEFKPQATVRAQVKQYKKGTPKLLLVEEGTGYNGKQYSGYILKRLEIERIDQVLELLQVGKEKLKEILNEGSSV